MHRVRTTNENFYRKVGRLQDAVALMQTIGFKEMDGFFVARLGIGAGDGGSARRVVEVLQLGKSSHLAS